MAETKRLIAAVAAFGVAKSDFGAEQENSFPLGPMQITTQRLGSLREARI